MNEKPDSPSSHELPPIGKLGGRFASVPRTLIVRESDFDDMTAPPPELLTEIAEMVNDGSLREEIDEAIGDDPDLAV